MHAAKTFTTIIGVMVLLSLLTACAGAQRPATVDEEAELRVATAEVPESEKWRSDTPLPGEPPDLVMPVFEQASLENGMRVIVSRRPDLPLVSFNLAVLAGQAADPIGKPGLSQLAYDLLLEGTGELGAMEIADRFADLGAVPYTSVDPDGGLIGVRVLSRNAEEALDLLTEIVRRPRLDEADFERKKRELIADLARAMGEPRWLANQALSALVFGEEHPYGQPLSPVALASITVEDTREFYESYFAPSSSAFVVTGDIDLETAVSLAEARFGDWSVDAPDSLPIVPPSPEVSVRENVQVISLPGLEQTVIMLGRPTIEVGHEDELALLLAGQVFGGMFGSRLNLNLREDKGYTYGAFSRVQPRRGVGSLTAGSSVQAEVTGAALTEVFAELGGLVERPITEEEFEDAREGFIRGIPGWFETIEALARTAASLFWRDLPLDRYDQVVEGLGALSVDDVRAAAQRYFTPASMHLVLVGDPELVEEQVSPLDLGKIIERPAPSVR